MPAICAFQQHTKKKKKQQQQQLMILLSLIGLLHIHLGIVFI